MSTTQVSSLRPAAPDFMAWWQQVQDELDLSRQQQVQVKNAVKKGSDVQKADAIRKMIDRIVCHWESVPTTDGLYKNGVKTVCRAVTIESRASSKNADGKPIEMMTIETPTGCSLVSGSLTSHQRISERPTEAPPILRAAARMG